MEWYLGNVKYSKIINYNYLSRKHNFIHKQYLFVLDFVLKGIWILL